MGAANRLTSRSREASQRVPSIRGSVSVRISHGRLMPTAMSLRIPASLAGSTVALLIAAAVRVAEVRGLAGLIELIQLLLLVAVSVYVLVVAERYEAHPLAGIYIWPSQRLRKLVFLAVLVALDCYLASIFVLGARVIDVVNL